MRSILSAVSVRQHPFASQWSCKECAADKHTSRCTQTIFILCFCSTSLDAASRPCLLSLDCEMCETATSSRELIGLSVVNEAGSTVLKVIGLPDCSFCLHLFLANVFHTSFPITAAEPKPSTLAHACSLGMRLLHGKTVSINPCSCQCCRHDVTGKCCRHDVTGNQAQQAMQLMHLGHLQMLVKPAGKVLNYRTEVTGATDATMQVRYCCISALYSHFAAR